MPWIRIDDHFDEHPKLAAVGPLVWGVWIASIAYCNRNLTDGFIPWSKARTLVSFETVDAEGVVWNLSVGSGMSGEDLEMGWVIDQLVQARIWDIVKDGKRITGYHIHDYDVYQPSREQVLADRAATAQRQAAWRERNAARNAVTNVVSNAPHNAPVTGAPNPTPKKKTTLSDFSLFEEAWQAYPARPNNSKARARKAWDASTKSGADPTQMIDGTRRYAEYVRMEATEPRYVKQASTFFGPDEWWLADYKSPNGGHHDTPAKIWDERIKGPIR